MPNTWQPAYDELKDYIAKHPSIEIGMNVVAIPGDVRPEFYHFFDSVRTNYIKDNFNASLEEGCALSKSYAKARSAVMACLELEDISVRGDVNWFLLDPVGGLIRVLFDPLFNLLRGKLDLASFEQTAIREVEEAFQDFFRDGYLRWVTLELIRSLKPEKNYRVQSMDYYTDPHLSEGDLGPGLRQEDVPSPVEARSLTFDKSLLSSFLVPKALLYSARLACFVAIRSDFNDAHWTAKTVSQNREWLDVQQIKNEFGLSKLWPDLAIYTGDRLEDMALVADYSRTARPDVIIDVSEEDWFDQRGLELLKRHACILRPQLGGFIVCRGPLPEASPKEQETEAAISECATSKELPSSSESRPVSLSGGNEFPTQEISPALEPITISLPGVGYDASGLEPIIETLRETCKDSQM